MKMKYAALIKDTFAEIKATRNRFLSIFAIIALGTGFFAGIKTTCPNMITTAQAYYEQYNLADIQLKSTMGFSEEDLNAISSLIYVQNMKPGYSLDAFCNTGDESSIVRIYSIDVAKCLTDGEYIDIPVLTEGRFPNEPYECIVDNGIMAGEYRLGDKITLSGEDNSSLEDSIKYNTFTIVGFVQSVQYVSFERGSSNIGNGNITSYMYVPDSAFTYEVYTDIYIRLRDTASVSFDDELYYQIIESYTEKLEKVADEREQERYDEIYGENSEKLDAAQRELDEAKEQYEAGVEQYNDNMASASRQLEDGKLQLQMLIEIRDILAATQPEDLKTVAEIYPQLAEILKTFGGDFITLPEDYSEIELLAYIASLESLKNNAAKYLDSTIKNAREQIKTGEREMKEAKATYPKQFEEAKAELDKAQAEIDDGYKQLSEVEKPTWYVLNRSNNPGYGSFAEDAERIDKIAAVFPVFFILVAALVCLTTMTRMVEEQRMQIGTLKALGYPRFLIMAKYLSYAALASFLGSAVGLAIGFKLFPTVIFNAYRVMYIMPSIIAPFKWGFGLIVTAVAVFCTTLTSFFACYKELFDTPASLMRPKSPPAGKVILLERIGFLWNRIGFLRKVSIRNLLRYKKRILMTIVGVAGCAALTFTGFGLQYAISAIVDLQYENVFQYDLLGIYESDLSDEQRGEISALLDKSDYASSHIMGGYHSVNASVGASGTKRECYLMVPEDTAELKDYIILQTRVEKNPISITPGGVVIAEKLSNLCSVKVGDKLRVYISDTAYADIPVSGITENYALNFIYMDKNTYEDYFGKPCDINCFMAIMPDTTKNSSLSTEMLSNSHILALSYTSESGKTFRDLVSSLNYIVVVIIICAGALAFVVLYNLANINVTERRRELATIKVLGFFDGEVSTYVNRESIISTLLGIACGMFLGVPLEKFVIKTAEVDSVMFVPNVTASCYIYAIVLTFGFSLIVNAVMHFKLKKIDMVESLKSVE